MEVHLQSYHHDTVFVLQPEQVTYYLTLMVYDHHCTSIGEIILLLYTLYSQIAVYLSNNPCQGYVEVANNGRCEGQVEAFGGATSELPEVLCYMEKRDRDSAPAASAGLSTMDHQSQVVPSRPSQQHLGPFEEKQGGSNHYLEMLDSSCLQD